jgi:predicted nucleic acid-binding protein
LERNEIPRYVPDASIAVKWFVKEEDSARARRLKELFQEGAIDLEAPSLLSYEVASALRFHPIAKLTPAQFRTVIESLENLQITREPTESEWTSAFMVSLENSLSIYDAVYVGFAVHGDSKIVTADTTLLTRIKSPETRARLILLAELEL